MELCRKLMLTIRRRLCFLTLSPRNLLLVTIAAFFCVYSIVTLKHLRNNGSSYYPADNVEAKPKEYTIQPGQNSDQIGLKRFIGLNNFSNHKHINAGKYANDFVDSVREQVDKARDIFRESLASNKTDLDNSAQQHPLYPKISMRKITDKCERIACNKGVCFENFNCIGLPPFLPQFKNPCFMEKVDPEDDAGQNAFKNFIISRMVPDPNIAPVQNFHKAWQRKRSTAPDGYQLRCLPYFFIIGMEKCGTTDIYQRIALHPDVILSPAKELQWWTRRRFFYTTGNNTFPPKQQSDQYKLTHVNSLQNVPFNHYYSFFDIVADQINKTSVIQDDGQRYHNTITGDGSPNTMYWNDFASIYGPNKIDGGKTLVAHHIAAVLPQARIIAILRNPTDRLYSSYMFFNKMGSKEKFHNIVVAGIQLFEDCLKEKSLHDCTYDPNLKENIGSTVNLMQGLYSVLLEDWYKVFPRSQVHVVHFESYKNSELSEVNKIFRFLHRREILPDESVGKQISERIVALEGKHHDHVGEMFPKTRRLLYDFHRPYNIKLAELLKDDTYLSWNDLASE